MLDGILVGLTVAGAAGYIIYRYAFKKSGGCTCECGSNAKSGLGGCCGGRASSPASCGGCGE